MVDGTVVDAKGEAMFVHAIQGMRPDSVGYMLIMISPLVSFC